MTFLVLLVASFFDMRAYLEAKRDYRQEEQAFLLKDGVFTADALQLSHHVGHIHAGAQGKGNETSDGFCLCGDGVSRFADGGEDFKGFAVHFIDGQIHAAETCLDFLGKSGHEIRALADANLCFWGGFARPGGQHL